MNMAYLVYQGKINRQFQGKINRHFSKVTCLQNVTWGGHFLSLSIKTAFYAHKYFMPIFREVLMI